MDEQAKQAIERGKRSLVKLTGNLPSDDEMLTHAVTASEHFAYICGYAEFLANRVAKLEAENERLKAKK